MKRLLILLACVFELRAQIYNPYRLRPGIKVANYEVTLAPNLNTRSFDGKVEVEFKALTNLVDTIMMHAKNLDGIELQVLKGDIIIKENSTDPRYDFIKYHLAENLTEGTDYRLELQYKGHITEGMDGFYISSYNDTVKTEVGTALSFPTNARTIFPCFDEPGLKAHISITIQCPENFTCISNMKAVDKENGLVEFHPTPLMSTYLVSFLISDFVAVAKNDSGPFRIIARPGAAGMGDYALEVGQKLLETMGEYTGIPYYTFDSNMKMDHVAIPDFSFGAMENWGIITYREDNLLYNPTHTSIKFKQRVASVVGHESAHMWFGNLATYAWFYCPWLSEAFGRYFEYFLTQSVEDFGMEEQFITAQLHTAFQADSSLLSKAMTYPWISSPDEILSHFGPISYNKGASILRMIEHWIGKENFRFSLQDYLLQKKYSNAIPEELMGIIQNHTNIADVYNTMYNWTTRSGYPILTVLLSENSNEILMRQNRYSRDGITGDIYPIPITYTVNDFEDTAVKFVHESYERSIPRPNDKWIVFNVQNIGFYRVRYEKELFNQLIDVLLQDTYKIHRYNRAQIVDDYINFGRDNYVDIGRTFDVIQYLDREVDFAPWSAAFTGLTFMKTYFNRESKIRDKFQEFISHLLYGVVKKASEVTEESHHLDKLLKMNTMSFACWHGNRTLCNNEVTEEFSNLVNNGIEVKPDNREYVYCEGLRRGNGDDYDYLWERFVTHNVPSETSVILNALGCTSINEKLDQFLGETIAEDTRIRDQDRMTAFNSALNGNLENVEKTFTFIRGNLARMKEVYGGGIITAMSSLSSKMSEDQLQRLEAFTLDNTVLTTPEKQTIRNKIIEDRRLVLRMASKSDAVLDWLDKYYSNSVIFYLNPILLIVTNILLILSNKI